MPIVVNATHLRGGQITYVKIGCDNTYQITVTVFTDTRSGVKFGGVVTDGTDVLDFGDGQTFIIPETTEQPLIQYRDVGMATYTVTHTYASPGVYRVTYTEPNRNESILNMSESVMTPFSLQSLIITNNVCSESSPTLLSPSVFVGSINTTNSFSLAQQSSSGYRLRYTLVTPRKERNAHVDDYFIPEGVSLNHDTGVLSWNTHGNTILPVGEYVFSVKIEQFDGEVSKGYVVSDIQVIMKDTMEGSDIYATTQLNEYQRVFVPANELRLVKVIAQSPEDFPQILLYSETPDIVLESYDSTSPNKYMRVGILTFTNTGSSERTVPYAVTVRALFDEGGVSTALRAINDITFLYFTKDTYLPEIITGTPGEVPAPGIYPNPVSDKIVLPGAHFFRVVDASGKCVQQGWASESLDVSELPQGMYMLQLFNGISRTRTTRFIKI